MFCTQCGNQIPDDSKFCNKCGRATIAVIPVESDASVYAAPVNVQPEPKVEPKVEPKTEAYTEPYAEPVRSTVSQAAPAPVKKGGLPKWLLPVIAAVLVVAVAAALFGGAGDASEPAALDGANEPVVVEAQNQNVDGWVEEDGKTCYYQNGVKCVGIIEINGAYYCFDDNGFLLKNTNYEKDGIILYVDGQGKILKQCYEAVWGEWSTEPFTDGGGKSSVMELSRPLENVLELEFVVEAAGRAGIRVDGNWHPFIRINGVWQEFPVFVLVGGATGTKIKFDSPVTIEAITAYPEIWGNATYDCNYQLKDVWCEYNGENGAPAGPPEMPSQRPAASAATLPKQVIKPKEPSGGGCCGSWY